MSLNKEAWLEVASALESGDFIQTSGRLNHHDRYCAAGVACELFYERLGLRKQVDDYGFGSYGLDFMSNMISPYQIREFLQTDRIPGFNLLDTIMEMNDFEHSSFPEIAAKIRLKVSEEE